jgi:hypothetical protein
MQRLLIAALGAAFVASTAAPALADDYPVCKDRAQDHCRVVLHERASSRRHDHHPGHHHHNHGPSAKKKP